MKMRVKNFPGKLTLKKCVFCILQYIGPEKLVYSTCNVVKNSEKTNGCTILLYSGELNNVLVENFY